jgi:DNA polymerase III delta prime subunit
MRKIIRISGKRTRKIVIRKIIDGNGEMVEMIKLLKKDTNLNQESDKEDFSYVFNDYFVDAQRYFYKLFHKIPNVLGVDKLNLKNASEKFENAYKTEIIDKIQREFAGKTKKDNVSSDIIFVMKDNTVIFFHDFTNCQILYTGEKTTFIENLIQLLYNHKVKEKHYYKINLITSGRHGLQLTKLDVKKVKLDIGLNYNDDFKPIHDIILKRLNKREDKGIVLLHGLPGTGKTTYLRYLTGKIKKRILFVPPNIAANIANPDFVNLLIENQNAILVIEDAENIVIDRNLNGGSAVSNLLNLADGLLSDFLSIQIICTFNTAISSVDSALLRKGRIIAKYEFKGLEITKGQLLSDKIGFNNKITKEMALSDIYNQDDLDFAHEHQAKKKIGFH